jgi:hypothetical protein
MLMLLCVASAEFPALSVHVPVRDWPAPSVVTVADAGELATPESVSLQLKLTVTSVLFQPFAFAAGDCDALADGAVLSMLIPVTVAELVFPALSAQVPVRDWFAPSVLTVCGLV